MALKRITYTSHALNEMQNRGITEAEVENCFKTPNKIVHQFSSRYRGIKKIDEEHALVVIYEKEELEIKVITTFKTSKVKKYL